MQGGGENFSAIKSLIHYIADSNLERIVEANGPWTPERKKTFVKALIAGTALLDFRQNVKPSAEYARVVDEPDQVFEIVNEEKNNRK